MSGIDKSEPISPSGNVAFYTQSDFVRQFHRVFLRGEYTISEKLPEDELELRRKLVAEEVEEFMVAMAKVANAQTLENKAELLDAIVDSVYVLLGTAVTMGLPFDVAFTMVHQANMMKLDSEGKPIIREDGKILKPEGWQPAPIINLLLTCFKHDTAQDAHQLAGLEGMPKAESTLIIPRAH